MLFVIIAIVAISFCEGFPKLKYQEPWLSESVVPLSYDLDFIFACKNDSLSQFLEAGLSKHKAILSEYPNLFDGLSKFFVRQPGYHFVCDTEEKSKDVEDPAHLQFIGAVNIVVKIKAPTSKIKLYVGDRIKVVSHCTSLMENEHEMKDAGPDRKVFQFNAPLTADTILNISLIYVSHFEYPGHTQDYHGSISADWVPQAWRFSLPGKIVLYTLNQPDRARFLYPSFDEPSFKSPFRVSLTVPHYFKTFSNEAEESVNVLKQGDNSVGKHVQFKTTQMMSTHHVAISAGHFKVSRQYVIANVTWRVIQETLAVRNFENQSRMFIARAAALYQSAKRLLDVDAQMSSKIDLMGVGTYVHGKAHPGLLIFNEERVFCLEYWVSQLTGQESPFEISTIFPDIVTSISVIAREIASLWVGSLVTSRWWNDYWLHEGLSSFLQFELGNSLGGQWSSVLYDCAKVLQNMEVLSDGSTAALQQLGSDSSDFQWNSFSHKKASSLLYMLKSVVGNEVFYAGIAKYLKDNRNSVTTVADFLSAMQSVVNKHSVFGPEHKMLNIKEFLNQWINAPDIPRISVVRGLDGKSVQFSQRPQSRLSPTSTLWNIPIALRFENSESRPDVKLIVNFWLTQQNATFHSDDVYNSFITLYDDPNRLYTVHYDPMYMKIAVENFPNCYQFSFESLAAYFMNARTVHGDILKPVCERCLEKFKIGRDHKLFNFC